MTARTPCCTAVVVAVQAEIFPPITYRLVSYEDRGDSLVEIDRRTGLNWAQVGGLVGNSGEGDAAKILVYREACGTEAEQLVLRYDCEGEDL